MRGSARTVCKMFELGLVTKEEARVWFGLDNAHRSVVEKVSEAVQQFAGESNHAAWFDSCCFRDSTLNTDRKQIIESYRAWCKENSATPTVTSPLLQYLRALGFIERKSGPNRLFAGFGLKPKSEEEDGLSAHQCFEPKGVGPLKNDCHGDGWHRCRECARWAGECDTPK